jgi:hypothetical protein
MRLKWVSVKDLNFKCEPNSLSSISSVKYIGSSNFSFVFIIPIGDPKALDIFK